MARFGGDEAEVKARAIKAELGLLYPAYAQYQQLLQLRGVQAKLPYSLEIK